MRITIPGLFLLVFASCLSRAQTNFPVFSDTAYTVSPNRLLMNTDGSFLVLGSLQSDIYQNSHGYIITRYAASGAISWEHVTRSHSVDTLITGHDMIPASDSGYIVFTDSAVFGSMTISSDALNLYKIDNGGGLVWESVNVNTAPSNNGLPGFVKYAPGTGHYFLINSWDSVYKFDASGNLLGHKVNPGILSDFVLTANDTVVGCITSPEDALCYCDSNAGIASVHGMIDGDVFYDVHLTSDSCWLLTGINGNAISDSVILTKTSYRGHTIWRKAFPYNDQSRNYITSMEYNGRYYISTSNEECLAVDSITNSCVGVSSALVLCTDTAGTLLSRLLIPGNAIDTDSVVCKTAIQSVIFNDTLYTLGAQKYVREYISSGLLLSTATVIGSLAVVWKNPLTSFVPLYTPSVHSDKTLVAYPDPATDEVTIYDDQLANYPVSVTVFDQLGRKLYHTSMDKFTPIHIVCSNWPRGLFIVNIAGPGISETGKFIAGR
jgi:voltage-gated potassium channel Kch